MGRVSAAAAKSLEIERGALCTFRIPSMERDRRGKIGRYGLLSRARVRDRNCPSRVRVRKSIPDSGRSATVETRRVPAPGLLLQRYTGNNINETIISEDMSPLEQHDRVMDEQSRISRHRLPVRHMNQEQENGSNVFDRYIGGISSSRSERATSTGCSGR